MQNLLFSGPWRTNDALNHTSAYNQNHFSEGPEQLCFYKKIALFYDPNVCLCISTTKSNNFRHDLGWQPNFQGPLNSLQVIFWHVIWTLGPPGSGPDPEKGGFCQIFLLWGFWGYGGRVTPFQNWDNKANKMLGAGANQCPL